MLLLFGLRFHSTNGIVSRTRHRSNGEQRKCVCVCGMRASVCVAHLLLFGLDIWRAHRMLPSVMGGRIVIGDTPSVSIKAIIYDSRILATKSMTWKRAHGTTHQEQTFASAAPAALVVCRPTLGFYFIAVLAKTYILCVAIDRGHRRRPPSPPRG